MTNNDKKLIAKYMGWWGENSPSNPSMLVYCRERNDSIDMNKSGRYLPYYIVAFDLNEAGLCVEEMLKRGEWGDFVTFVEETSENRELCYTWSENFFGAMAAWLKEGKK